MPTPTSSMVTMADMEQAKYAGNGGKRPSYQEAKTMWPTPQANKTTPNTSNPDDLVNSSGEPWQMGEKPYDRRTGKPVTTCLGDAVKMWPTPSASVANDGEKPETWLASAEKLKEKHINGNGAGMPLTIAAQLWPTPTKSDGGGGPGCSGREGGKNLRTAVQSFPTPRANDWKGGLPANTKSKRAECDFYLPDKVNKLEGGSGQLNPAWVELLMGFPVGWTIIGDQDGKTEPPDSPPARKIE